jgi:hypothetical protein
MARGTASSLALGFIALLAFLTSYVAAESYPIQEHLWYKDYYPQQEHYCVYGADEYTPCNVASYMLTCHQYRM